MYNPTRVAFAPWIPLLGTSFRQNRIPNREYIRNGKRYTSMGWEVRPESLYDVLVAVRDNYGNIPVYITENGAAFTDRLEDYRVHDEARVNYLAEHTAQAARRITSYNVCYTKLLRSSRADHILHLQPGQPAQYVQQGN